MLSRKFIQIKDQVHEGEKRGWFVFTEVFCLHISVMNIPLGFRVSKWTKVLGKKNKNLTTGVNCRAQGSAL